MSKKQSKRRLEVTRGIKEGAQGINKDYEDKKSKGVIRGAAIMTKGNVKDDRNWGIDDTTLEQIVSAGAAHKNLGLKSRFGHPNMSATALGTFLGRMKNFVKDGDIVRADLYLSKTAYDTPNGDLASYVLDLAEKDPEAFGTSVVLGDFELEDQQGKKNSQSKESKEALPPLLRVKSLMSVDAVDSPAANNSMFGSFFNESVELSAKATEFLDNFLDSPDAVEKIITFLERYRNNRGDTSLVVEKIIAFLERYKNNWEDTSLGEVFDCECIVCGYKMESEEHCNNLKCPECGGQMRRVGRPGPGQEGQDKKQEVVEMGIELKDLTLEQLKQERPKLVADLESSAAETERTRSLKIVKAAQQEFAGMGMEKLLEEAIEKGQDLDAALAAMRGKRLKDLEAEGNKAPGADKDAPAASDHLSRAKKYQEEHKSTLAEALRETAEPRKE